MIWRFGAFERYADGTDCLVLKGEPVGSDYPASAGEYLLADRDEVVITGSALTNKTVPRLLELCADARVVLVGPSTPCAPEVFRRASQRSAAR